MKPEPPPVLRSETPHDRFVELGKKIMAASKADVDAREKKWQQARKQRRKHR
jgi:hypothetical protein